MTTSKVVGTVTTSKVVGTVNVAGETVPVDRNGAYPLAGWEIEGALHGVTPILSPGMAPPKRPGVYVYNTRIPSETSPAKPGHWVAVYIPQQGASQTDFEAEPLEFFDSFGRAPEEYGDWPAEVLREWGSPRWLYNPVPLQESGSFACGYYVIAYCAFRLIGWTMSDFLSLFNPSLPAANDSVAVHLAEPMVRRLGESYNR